MTPLILNAVPKIAEIELPIDLVTAYGPILLGPFSLVISAVETITLVDAPPDPATIPTLGESRSSSVSDDISIASFAARYEYAADSPIKRRSFLSINLEKSISIDPDTWLLNPISAYELFDTIPDFPFLRLSRTSL